MSYYTSYRLEVQGINFKPELEKLTDELDRMEVLSYAIVSCEFDPLSDTQIYPTYEPTTWYDHEQDMLDLSKKFPELTFKLTCIGETFAGVYECYVRNGKCEKRYASFPQPQYIPWD